MALAGSVEIFASASRPLSALYGDGSDPTRDHQLGPNALLTALVLPRPRPGTRSCYVRVTSRAHAEWALVEVAVRVTVERDVITDTAVVAGAVAPVPLRLPEVEAVLRDAGPGLALWTAAAQAAARTATPLPQTAYKARLLVAAIEDALLRADDTP
ncbi:MAG: hypothetical protein JNK45_33260 [Myxococcales bacterium]|nr:hypothetical protein [Myxococcales bacterium]